jgi:hypothetical protein
VIATARELNPIAAERCPSIRSTPGPAGLPRDLVVRRWEEPLGSFIDAEVKRAFDLENDEFPVSAISLDTPAG